MVIMTVDLPSIAFGVGEFTLDCGALDTAGKYRVLLEANVDESGGIGTVVALTSMLTVSWPRLNVVLPSTHGALEAPVDVTVTMPTGSNHELRCESQHGGIGYAIQTVYLGRTEMKNGVRVVLPRKVCNACVILYSDVNVYYNV